MAFFFLHHPTIFPNGKIKCNTNRCEHSSGIIEGSGEFPLFAGIVRCSLQHHDLHQLVVLVNDTVPIDDHFFHFFYFTNSKYKRKKKNEKNKQRKRSEHLLLCNEGDGRGELINHQRRRDMEMSALRETATYVLVFPKNWYYKVATEFPLNFIQESFSRCVYLFFS